MFYTLLVASNHYCTHKLYLNIIYYLFVLIIHLAICFMDRKPVELISIKKTFNLCFHVFRMLENNRITFIEKGVLSILASLEVL